MSIPLVVVGATFNYPVNFDENWGIEATGWAQAVTNGMLQRSGGSFPLTADANFGGSFGLISEYFTSHTALPSLAGTIRLAKTDTIDWRNNANNADNILAVNSSDQLQYNGVIIGAAAGVISLNSLSGNLNIVGTANEIIVTPSSPNITLSTPQAINTTSSPTFVLVTANLMGNVTGNLSGNVTGNLTGTVTGHSTLDLALTGGTMSGAIAMGSNKITGVTQGTVSGDAISFPVAAAQITSATITTTQVASNTLTGSTANSGGSAGNVAQGTISTADLRASAVTQVINVNDGASSSFASGTTVDTITITTTGGPVLLMGTAVLGITSSGGNAGADMAIVRSSNKLPGSEQRYSINGQTGTVLLSYSSITIDPVAAGTYTYTYAYIVQQGTFASVNFHGFTAIEIKK